MNEHFTKQYWLDQWQSFVHALGTKKFWRELIVMTLGMGIGAAAVYYFRTQYRYQYDHRW